MGSEKMQASSTPLKTKIEQLLTEARLIIPGGQALLGFQFVGMLTSAFDRLPESAKMVHALALCLIEMNVIIMMTPGGPAPAVVRRRGFASLSHAWLQARNHRTGLSRSRHLRGSLCRFHQGAE
jgi:hypothetical protein